MIRGEFQSRFNEAYRAIVDDAYVSEVIRAAEKAGILAQQPLTKLLETARMEFHVAAAQAGANEGELASRLRSAIRAFRADLPVPTITPTACEGGVSLAFTCSGDDAKAWEAVLDQCKAQLPEEMVLLARQTQTRLLEAQVGSTTYRFDLDLHLGAAPREPITDRAIACEAGHEGSAQARKTRR